MNQYVKIGLAVLGVIGIGLETACPHAAWVIPVTTGITAVLTTMHVLPETPANVP